MEEVHLEHLREKCSSSRAKRVLKGVLHFGHLGLFFKKAEPGQTVPHLWVGAVAAFPEDLAHRPLH